MDDPVYIALDTETGGIGADKSLLTAYIAILNSELNIINDIYLRCKPDDGIYRVTGKGMEINGINLGEHDKVATPYKDSGKALRKFLYDNRIQEQGQYLKAIGQNVKFDIQRVTGDLVDPELWNTYVSYRTLDTAVIAGFGIDIGLLPSTLNAGLKAMAEYFGLGVQEDTNHDAKKDVLLTIGVYKELKKLFKDQIKN